MRRYHWVGSLITLVTLLGCGATEEQLRTRAAFDMNCSEDRLNIVEIDERTRGVRGCNQQATYIESCQDINHRDCTWVLNTDGKRRQSE